jgi:hypothetical protein
MFISWRKIYNKTVVRQGRHRANPGLFCAYMGLFLFLYWVSFVPMLGLFCLYMRSDLSFFLAKKKLQNKSLIASGSGVASSSSSLAAGDTRETHGTASGSRAAQVSSSTSNLSLSRKVSSL